MVGFSLVVAFPSPVVAGNVDVGTVVAITGVAVIADVGISSISHSFEIENEFTPHFSTSLYVLQ